MQHESEEFQVEFVHEVEGVVALACQLFVLPDVVANCYLAQFGHVVVVEPAGVLPDVGHLRPEFVKAHALRRIPCKGEEPERSRVFIEDDWRAVSVGAQSVLDEVRHRGEGVGATIPFI